MTEQAAPAAPPPPPPPDNGLRTILTWTFIALVISVIAAVIGVNLVIKLFG